MVDRRFSTLECDGADRWAKLLGEGDEVGKQAS
jgi:hypothetical protein